jgi:hypothetical protein
MAMLPPWVQLPREDSPQARLAFRERVLALGSATGGERLAAALAAADEAVRAEEETAAAAAARRAREPASPQLSNERILHELLHDPGWRLPDVCPAEDDVDDTERRANAAAQRAFWASLAVSERPLSCAAGVLSALAADIIELARNAPALSGGDDGGATLAERVSACLESGVTLVSLSAEQAEAEAAMPAAAVAALPPTPHAESAKRLEIVMRCFSAAVRLLAAPDRLSAFNAALESLGTSAVARPQGELIAAALQLLHEEVRRLRRDAANAAVAALAPLVSKRAGEGAGAPLGLRVARNKFMARHRLALDEGNMEAPEAQPLHVPLAALPDTRAALAAAAGRPLAAARAELGESIASVGRGGGGSSSAAVPAMQTGLRRLNPRVSDSGPEGEVEGGVASLDGAEALLRLALIEHVLASPQQAAVPETLLLDSERLAAATEEAGRLMYSAAALLLLPQLSDGAGQKGEAARLQSRLAALLSGAATDAWLATASAELARASGCTADTAERLLQSLLGQDARASRALQSSLSKALRAHLLLGGAAGASRAAAALARAGAVALAPETAALGGRLARVACVQWALHGRLYTALAPTTGQA